MGMGLSQDVVAKVEGEEIRVTELVEAMNRQMDEAMRAVEAQGKSGNAETRKFLENLVKAQVTPQRVLESLIQRHFLIATATHAGLRVAPESIREAVQAMPVFQDSKGRFDPLQYKARVVRPALFEQDIANELRFMAFRSAFHSGLSQVSSLAQKDSAALNEGRVYEILEWDPRQFVDSTQAKSEDVQKWLTDPASVAALQNFYDRHVEEFKRPEQVRAAHILVADESLAQSIQKEIASGKTTFSAAAAKHSLDRSNKNKGGDLDFFSTGMMDPAFEKAAFSLTQKGQISAPVKSSFGWHLIQLTDRRPALDRSLESVKNEIAPAAFLEAKRVVASDLWTQSILQSNKVPSPEELKKRGVGTWKRLEAWTPMDERLGSLGTADILEDLLKLNGQKSLLPRMVTLGEKRVLVRWIQTETTKDAKKATPNNPANVVKAEDALNFYMQKRFEKLTQSKDILRSEKVLSSLSKQMAPPQG